ncbi:hypothetical protein [Lactiplantibacillus plantarum]|nr:hypothetical protein [Lactiplantibacillus plantarum]
MSDKPARPTQTPNIPKRETRSIRKPNTTTAKPTPSPSKPAKK